MNLIGWIRKSNSGTSLKVSLDVKDVNGVKPNTALDGQEFYTFHVELDKLQEVINDERDIAGVKGPEIEVPVKDPNIPFSEFDPKLFEIDKLWRWVNRIQANVVSCETQFKELFDCHYQPFHSYPVESYLTDVYKNAVRAVCEISNRAYQNVPLPVDDIVRHFWGGSHTFDVCDILEYLQDNYFGKAPELSMKEIYHKSRALIPWGPARTDNDLTARADSFTKGKKLVLNHYNSYDNFHNVGEALSYFEKMCAVIMDGADPVTVENKLWKENKKPADKEEIWVKHDLANCHIKAFKWHKNGNLYVWFGNPEDAEIMARILAASEAPMIGIKISEPKPGTIDPSEAVLL